jgi:hypothetical protein
MAKLDNYKITGFQCSKASVKDPFLKKGLGTSSIQGEIGHTPGRVDIAVNVHSPPSFRTFVILLGGTGGISQEK